ncbi:MAG: hypothetical protein ABI112_13285 [Terracoccus sp.]
MIAAPARVLLSPRSSTWGDGKFSRGIVARDSIGAVGLLVRGLQCGLRAVAAAGLVRIVVFVGAGPGGVLVELVGVIGPVG